MQLSRVVLVVLLMLVCVGCGKRDAANIRTSNGVIPSSAAAIAVVDIRSGGNGGFQQMRSVLKRVPMYELVDERVPVMQEIMDRVINPRARSRLSYERDIRPWLGHTAGLFILRSDRGRRVSSPAELDVVAWIDTTDGEAATAAMERLGGSRRVGVVHRYVINRTIDSAEYAIVGDHLVIGSTHRAMVAAIDAHVSAAYEQSDEFKVLTKLPSGHHPLVTLVIPAGGVARIGDLLSASRPGMLPAQASILQSLQSLAAALADDHGVSVAIASSGDGLFVDALRIDQFDARGVKEPSFPDEVPVKDVPGPQVIASLDTRHMVDSLPAATVLAIGRAAPATHSVDLIPDQVNRLTGVLAEASSAVHELAPGSPGERAIAMVRWMVADTTVSQARKAFMDRWAGGLVVYGYRLGAVARIQIRDVGAARRFLMPAITALARASTTSGHVAISHARSRAGRSCDPLLMTCGRDDTATFSGFGGIDIGGVLSRMVDTSASKLAVDPLVIQLHQSQHAMRANIGPFEVLAALPDWGMTLLRGSIADGPSLRDNDHFIRDMKVLDVPDDSGLLGWLDVQVLVKAMLEPVNEQTGLLVDGQLGHVGGITLWTHHEVSDNHVVTHLTLAMPVFS